MISNIQSWLLAISDFLIHEANFLDALLQGLVSTSGIFVLRNLMKTGLLIQTLSKEDGTLTKGFSRRVVLRAKHWLSAVLHFCCLTAVLGLLSSQVASLVVLEFSLRAVSSWVTASPTSGPSPALQTFVHCQFSLGCALSCSVNFLQDGAPKRSLNLLLTAGLSLLLARWSGRLWHHVMELYPLHSSQSGCGVCMSLLTSGHTLLPFLSRCLALTFGVAAVSAVCTLNRHFESTSEALRFWTPLTICYTLLVVYIQEDQQGTAVQWTPVVRLGSILLLMMTVGHWKDVLHVLVCFLGEACCLIPSQDLLSFVAQEVVKEASSNSKLTVNSYSKESPQSAFFPKRHKLVGTPGREMISQMSGTDVLCPAPDLKCKNPSAQQTKEDLCKADC